MMASLTLFFGRSCMYSFSFQILFVLSLFASSVVDAYHKPSQLPQETWEELSPYFLPEDHPIKPTLDKIFHKRSVTKNTKTVLDAGFFNGNPGKYSKVVVTGHLRLKGYIVKMYLDSNGDVNEAEKFKERVLGALSVKKYIDRFNLHDVVKVPRKWIYPIPRFSNSGTFPKRFILIAEDMQPYSESKSLSMWKKKVSNGQLDAVWLILKKAGLPDCAYAFNIPFCRDGKLAFLDTEYCRLWPIHYRRMNQYLSGDKLSYWIKLTQ